MLWRVELPQLGLTHRFLLSGILSITALHLATLSPHRKNELHQFAIAEQARGLPSFRAALSKPNSDSINAVFGFGGAIVYYIMASPENYAGQEVDRCRIPSRNDDHPHWFQTMRGLMEVLRNNWSDLKSGVFAPLLASLPPGSAILPSPPGDDHLAGLEEMFSIRLGPSSQREEEIIDTCRDALTALREISALSHSYIPAIKASIHMWPGRVKQDYMDLIYDRDPRALAILAHYCVLLKRNNHVWYLRGIGFGMLENIKQTLTEEWRPWIEWAIQQPSS